MKGEFWRRALLLAAAIGVNACTTAVEPAAPEQLRQERAANDWDTGKRFSLTVYLNSARHPGNLQMPQMLAQLASHGVTRLILLSRVYLELAPQGLHEVAHQWDIEVIPGMIAPNPRAPWSERTEQEVAETVRYLSRFNPDGYYVEDEIEINLDPESTPGVLEHLQKIVQAFEKYAPGVPVIVNHTDHPNQDGTESHSAGTLFYGGENTSYCSVFWANRYGEKRLRKLQREFARVYGRTPAELVCIYGAQGTARAIVSDAHLPMHDLEGTPADFAAISIRDDIADYLLTPFRLGFGGSGIFAYDGYYDYRWYSLVNERGESVDGRMEGMLDGMRLIRTAEGAPELAMEVTPEARRVRLTPKANVLTGTPVAETVLEISYDGGFSFEPVPGVPAQGGEVTVDLPLSWMRFEWSMLRARCRAGDKWSLWQVWNVLPAPDPRDV